MEQSLEENHSKKSQIRRALRSGRCVCFTYGFVVGLVAVVASGQISDSRDGETTAFLGIRVLLASVVAQALKQAANYFLIMADEVGVLTDVVAISYNEE